MILYYKILLYLCALIWKSMDKSFEKAYYLQHSMLRLGNSQATYTLQKDFFSHFEHSPIQNADVTVHLDIVKYETHLDVKFHIEGKVEVECDRCMEWMNYPISGEERVIYSFDKSMKFSESDDVVYANPKESNISLVSDIYDFVCISLPLRKVHEDIEEQCSEEILKYIVGQVEEEEEEDA